MKRMGILLMIIAFFSAVAGPSVSEDPNKEKPYIWKPVLGLKHPSKKGYYDKNNTRKEIIDKTEFGLGVILISDKLNSSIMLDGKNLSYKSMIKYVMVDCSNGIMVQLYDYFYMTEFPKQEDVPKFYIKYEPDAANYSMLNKGNSLYNIACPVSV